MSKSRFDILLGKNYEVFLTCGMWFLYSKFVIILNCNFSQAFIVLNKCIFAFCSKMNPKYFIFFINLFIINYRDMDFLDGLKKYIILCSYAYNLSKRVQNEFNVSLDIFLPRQHQIQCHLHSCHNLYSQWHSWWYL